jgi:putative ABC transport system substrate-binding protein
MRRNTGGGSWARVILTCLCLLALGPRASGTEPRSFVIVTSRADGPYAGVVSGAQGVLVNRRPEAPVLVHSLDDNKVEAMTAVRSARGSGDTPLLTVGSAATRAALASPGDGPVIACMVADKQGLENARNATGVLLEFPLKMQLEWIGKFLPKSEAIGVLYNPAENAEQIEEAKKAAGRLGFRLIARQVRRPQDLPDALKSVSREADMLWAVTDQTVLSRKTAQAILLFSFRNKMPFSGLSASWVKAGALYALDRDYEDLGAQCAEMAVEVLDGKRAAAIEIARPRKVVYVLNMRTADHLDLNLPPDLVDGAAELFR